MTRIVMREAKPRNIQRPRIIFMMRFCVHRSALLTRISRDRSVDQSTLNRVSRFLFSSVPTTDFEMR